MLSVSQSRRFIVASVGSQAFQLAKFRRYRYLSRAALLEVMVIDHLNLDIRCTPVRQSRGNVENGEFNPVGILNQFAGDHLDIDNITRNKKQREAWGKERATE